MNLDIKFDELERLVEKMKAPPASWTSKPVELGSLVKIQRELEKGKEISIDKVEVLDSRLLTYKGQQIVLYIMNLRE